MTRNEPEIAAWSLSVPLAAFLFTRDPWITVFGIFVGGALACVMFMVETPKLKP